ncbi:MAG: tRNA pseudouridine(38-40) synthase TruA [Geminicoccaceae bacterium]|nr:tRNA pseudouridine(38-40) synthase TruA [Geminicoccaceae bacterium]
MPRYRLLLEYDGGPFHGWQIQTNGPSVQAALEAAVTKLTGERVTAVAAGRTDSGVHALAMPVHMDLVRDWPPERLVGGLNAHLRPAPIAVLEVSPADDGFHARFSAMGRRYLYRILNRRAPAALLRGRAWHVPTPLDAAAMAKAAACLVGRHDFTSFRAAHCQAKSPLKTLHRLEVSQKGGLVEIEAAAPSFLHHQVRNIVGTLKLVGEGRKGVDFVEEALRARDRAAAGPTAPPEGLYFVAAEYGAT